MGISLARYAAKAAGWYPSDDLEALKCDMIAESINELLSAAPKSKDQEELKKLRQEFQETTMTKYWNWIEGIIQGNGGCYVSGTSPTYVELSIAGCVAAVKSGFWDHIDTQFFDQYPGVLATIKAIEENEKIKAYKASKE